MPQDWVPAFEPAALLAVLILVGALASITTLALALRDRPRWISRLPAIAAGTALFGASLISAWTYPVAPPFDHLYNAMQLFAGESHWTEQAFERAGEDAWLAAPIHAVRILAIFATFSLLASLFQSLHPWLQRVTARSRGHILVCGLGEVGMEFVQRYEETRARAPRVVRGRWARRRLRILEVDGDNPNVAVCREQGFAVSIGDALDPEVLRSEGRVRHAAFVLHLLPDDAQNIELAMTVRGLCESWEGRWHRRKLLKAREALSRWVRALEATGRVRSRPAFRGTLEKLRSRLEGEPARLLVHVDDLRLTRRAEAHNRLGPEQCTQTRFFSVHEDAARQLFRDHPPDLYAAMADARAVHLAFHGYDAMTESCILQALRQCHYLGGVPLHITIFDAGFQRFPADPMWRADAPSARVSEALKVAADCPLRRELTWRFRGVSNMLQVQLHFRPLEADARCPDEALLQACAHLSDNLFQPPTQHFVCFAESRYSARYALALRERLRVMGPVAESAGGAPRAWNASVFARFARKRGLSRMFGRIVREIEGGHAPIESPDALHPFGMLEDVLQPAELFDEQRDRLARIFHDDGYLPERAVQPARPASNAWHKEAQVDWPHLNVHFKQSNRAQADHVDAKLRAIRGARAVPSWRPPGSALSPEQHDRWWEAHRAAEGPVEWVAQDGSLLVTQHVLGYGDRKQRIALVYDLTADHSQPSALARHDGTVAELEPGLRVGWKAPGWQAERSSATRRLEVTPEGGETVGFDLPSGAQEHVATPQEEFPGDRDEALARLPAGMEVTCIQRAEGRLLLGTETGVVYAFFRKRKVPRLELVAASSWQRYLLRECAADTAARTRLEALAILEHTRWNGFHFAANWTWGTRRADAVRIHSNLCAWDDLDGGTKRFDRTGLVKLARFLDSAAEAERDEALAPGRSGAARGGVDAVAKERTLCRRLTVGMLVRSPPAAGMAEADSADAVPKLVEALVEALEKVAGELSDGLPVSFELVALGRERSERGLLPVLADRLRAQMLLLLPVPFEQFYRDLPQTRDEAGEVEERWRAVQEYVALVARAERHLELPLRFGPFQELDEHEDVRERRQYQLAEAWMLQHADAVLELWPGAAADPVAETETGTGGCDPIVDWWREPESIPAAFRWTHRMHEPPPREKATRALRELPGPWRGRLLTSVLRRESEDAPQEATPAGDA